MLDFVTLFGHSDLDDERRAEASSPQLAVETVAKRVVIAPGGRLRGKVALTAPQYIVGAVGGYEFAHRLKVVWQSEILATMLPLIGGVSIHTGAEPLNEARSKPALRQNGECHDL